LSSIGLINSFSLSSSFEFMQPATNELNGFSREDVNKMGGQAVAAYDKSPAEEVVDSSRKTLIQLSQNSIDPVTIVAPGLGFRVRVRVTVMWEPTCVCPSLTFSYFPMS